MFGLLQWMPDDCKMADRRRKKRIGVSKKFRTYVHPYEHTGKAGHIPVCRGEHRSSAAGANDNNTPMQIRKPNRVRICIGVLQLGGIIPRTANGRPYNELRTP